MTHLGQHYILTPEKSSMYLRNIFTHTAFPAFPEYISIKVKAEQSPGSMYFTVDIFSDIGDLKDEIAYFEESEKGTQIFIKMRHSQILSPIGSIFGLYDDIMSQYAS